jgi:histidinol-phosphate aminotransferase
MQGKWPLGPSFGNILPVPRKNPRSLIRPLVRDLQAYVPGEQPKIRGLIKLNTNENPYPPSPRVLEKVKAAVDGRLRLYPPPTAQALREKLARFHQCSADRVLVGNGSDELLAMAVRTFAEPGRGVVQWFTPSYSLYPVLAAIHGARSASVPLEPDFGLPPIAKLRRTHGWRFDASVTLITTPNAPSGRGYSRRELEALCAALKGVVILDEAYVDFAPENAMSLALKHPNVIVSRTFSKGYSLCYQRVGYFVGHPELIAALDKIRDSYNVNGLGQIAALATLDDLPFYRRNFRKIVSTRARLTRELRELDFRILPSQTNFILARPPRFPAKEWLARLRKSKILVRWFDGAATRDFLRITIGTDAQSDALVRTAQAILRARD